MNLQIFLSINFIWKCNLQNISHFVQASTCLYLGPSVIGGHWPRHWFIYQTLIQITHYWLPWCPFLHYHFPAYHSGITWAPWCLGNLTVCWTAYLSAYQREHQSPALLVIVRRIHQWNKLFRIAPKKTSELPHYCPFVRGIPLDNIKENIRTLHYRPFVRAIHHQQWWIPLIKGQWFGCHFHILTSLCPWWLRPAWLLSH